MPNFADIASKPVAEIERPPLAPVGTYRWSIPKLPVQTTSNDGKWDILTVNCRALSAEDDVDLEGYAGEVTNITNSVKFMFNKEDEVEFEKQLYRMRTFFEKHVQCANEGDTIGQMLNNSVNGQFLGSIGWSQDKNDAELFYANIVRTAPVE